MTYTLEQYKQLLDIICEEVNVKKITLVGKKYSITYQHCQWVSGKGNVYVRKFVEFLEKK